MHQNVLNFATLAIALALCSFNAGVLVMARSSDSGIEYVKACDSGADDVTNQCINRIPEDIGVNSGNHACAYHEAEVKCLGLCGNTVTWKVAYRNSLKRYRLVCANYIDERLAEKDDEGEAGGGSDMPASPPPKKKPAPADLGNAGGEGAKNGANDQPKGKKAGSATEKSPEVAAKKAPPAKKEPASLSPPAAPKSKPSSTQPASSKPSIDIDLDQIKTIADQSNELKHKQQQESGVKEAELKKKALKDQAQALLPSMDPEVAAASIGASAMSLASLLVAFLAAVY
ncbi:hypothetical protein H4R26_001597 [Coemansia thaxteri]|uniref:Uncharacterized protein n=1 Tax=Coemansia thaxteri TaxID=2663907 RepID=A0A9W8EKC4_9FUNG|nr:hypothetical protein H4R26_001597 [Coemansia thaxteri]KAJ2486125.1 hypothetical protein EV174_001312 [Coemansia sp. RSA 2320]